MEDKFEIDMSIDDDYCQGNGTDHVFTAPPEDHKPRRKLKSVKVAREK